MPAHVLGWSPPALSVELDGIRDAHRVVFNGDRVWVDGPGFEVELRVVPRFPDAREQVVEGGLTAPMNGTVIALEVPEGERVRKGQTILVIEAMKMEHRVAAPCDGVVEKLLTQPGAVVAAGQVVAIVARADGDSDEAVPDQAVPDETAPEAGA
jgi:propionyl-CoA carboxylase alpha chain